LKDILDEQLLPPECLYEEKIDSIKPLPQNIELNFRNYWTDNANALSRSYTGTDSLKTD